MHNLKHVEIVWCSREKSFGQKFLDPVAMEFLLESAAQKKEIKAIKEEVETKNCTYHGEGLNFKIVQVCSKKGGN